MTKGACANCGIRPGTKRWVGEGGALDMVHGFYEMWCEVCVLEKQLANAEERAALIPEMRTRLEALRGAR